MRLVGSNPTPFAQKIQAPEWLREDAPAFRTSAGYSAGEKSPDQRRRRR